MVYVTVLVPVRASPVPSEVVRGSFVVKVSGSAAQVPVNVKPGYVQGMCAECEIIPDTSRDNALHPKSPIKCIYIEPGQDHESSLGAVRSRILIAGGRTRIV